MILFVIFYQDYREGTKPVVTKGSGSMASINSIPNAQSNLGSDAFCSMTSLKSADDVLLPAIKNTSEQKAIGTDPGTKATKENSDSCKGKSDIVEVSGENDDSEKLIEISPRERMVTKLAEILPTDNVITVHAVNGAAESESNTDNASGETGGKAWPKSSDENRN